MLRCYSNLTCSSPVSQRSPTTGAQQQQVWNSKIPWSQKLYLNLFFFGTRMFSTHIVSFMLYCTLVPIAVLAPEARRPALPRRSSAPASLRRRAAQQLRCCPALLAGPACHHVPQLRAPSASLSPLSAQVRIPFWALVYMPLLVTCSTVAFTPGCAPTQEPPLQESLLLSSHCSRREGLSVGLHEAAAPRRAPATRSLPLVVRSGWYHLVGYVLYENAMSVVRISAMWSGLLELSDAHEWVVTSKLGNWAAAKAKAATARSPPFVAAGPRARTNAAGECACIHEGSSLALILCPCRSAAGFRRGGGGKGVPAASGGCGHEAQVRARPAEPMQPRRLLEQRMLC